MQMLPTRFVLLSSQRTGSTWVIDMLNSHPQVVAYSELFLQNGRGVPTWGGAKDFPFFETYASAVTVPRNTNPVWSYLDDMYSADRGARSIGFKLMYQQAGAYAPIIAYLKHHVVSVCHLIRRNLLDICISRALAADRDAYHRRESEVRELIPISLDPSTLLSQLEKQEASVLNARCSYGKMGVPYCEVFYEDLRAGKSSFDVILRFIDVQPMGNQLASNLGIMNPYNHAQVIENYDVIRSLLRATRFSDLLQ